MPWTVPPMPDDLKAQLMRRQNPMAPAGAVPPPGPPAPSALAYGPQPTPQTVAANQAVEGGGQPAAQPQAQPAAKPAPPPTDDPNISSQPKTPDSDPAFAPVQRPADVSSYLNPALSRMSDLMAKRAAVPAVDPQKTKPKLWERLAGIALGATQLKNPENAGAVADSVVHRRLYGAEQQRNLALQPIDEQLKAEKESFPLYTAAGEAAYRQASLGQKSDEENRLRGTARATAGYHEELAGIKDQLAQATQQNYKDKAEQANNKLQELYASLDNQRMNAQDRIAATREIADAHDQLRQMQLQQQASQFATGTSAKDLEAERKQRNDAIENDWKQHSWINPISAKLGLSSKKESEHKAVNDDINTRLALVKQGGAPGGATGGAPSTPVAGGTGSALKVGAQVMVDGKPMVVKGFHPNGKPIVGNP